MISGSGPSKTNLGNNEVGFEKRKEGFTSEDTQKPMDKALLKNAGAVDTGKKSNSSKKPKKQDDANDTCGCILF